MCFAKLRSSALAELTKITVIGAGNGGLAAAADLALRGYDVTLAEHPRFESNITKIAELGGIELEALPSSGLKSGFAKLSCVTSDMERALAGAELVLLIVPSFAQVAMAEICAPHAKSGQIFILTPGNFGGAYDFYRHMVKAGANTEIKVGEASSLMYACRKTSDTGVWLRGYKHALEFAAFPGKDTDFIMERIRNVYPCFVKAKSTWVTGLSAPNTLLHTPIMLGNIANIDNQADMFFYHQATTESVGRIMDAMDEERMALNQFGFGLQSLASIVKSLYPHQGATGERSWELCHSNPVYVASKLPTTLNHRYITEDLPYGLIPMQHMLRKFNLPCPTITAVVNLIETASNKKFDSEARTLDSLGLGGCSPEELLRFAEEG